MYTLRLREDKDGMLGYTRCCGSHVAAYAVTSNVYKARVWKTRLEASKFKNSHTGLTKFNVSRVA